MKVFILVVSALLFSCSDSEDELNLPAFEGTYEGTFTVEYLERGDTFTNPVMVTFNNGTYASTSGPNRTPAGGSGKFEMGTNSVTFDDENFWTADFDWNLILSGEYSVTETESKIILTSRVDNVAVYTYELMK